MLSTTASINIDLQRPSIIVIHAKQFDALSRYAEIHLFSSGEPWSIEPSKYAYAVQYRKPDGTKGLYDKLPDGETDAVSASLGASGETVLLVRFAPQMFTVAGNVKCSVAIMNTGDGTKLQTCSFDVLVAASEVSGDESKDYYKMVTLEGLQNQIGDLDGLATYAKDNLVAAINDVLGKFGALMASDIANNVAAIPAKNVSGALAYLQNQIGNLDGLATSAKDNLVAAINEVIRKFSARIGVMSNLTTTNKSSLVSAINEVLGKFGDLDAADIAANVDGIPAGNVAVALSYLQALAQPYVVNMTKNADGTYSADKTFAALKAAHDAGKTVICSFKDLTRQWDGPVRLPLAYLGDTYMGFAAVVEPEQGDQIFAQVYINSGGMGYTATVIATNDTVSTMIAAAIGDTATALSDMDSVIGGAGA